MQRAFAVAESEKEVIIPYCVWLFQLDNAIKSP